MSNDKQNPIQFLADKLLNGKPYTPRDLSYYLAEAEAKYKDAIEQAKLDAMETEIIKQCAERSTSNASKYAEGYKEGYKRALEYITDTIKNKIEIKRDGSNIFTTTGTTSTTFLCTQFVAQDRITTSLPNCIKCGKPQYQHPMISNTQ
jgi:DNA-binding transcriptional MocR family regulator